VLIAPEIRCHSIRFLGKARCAPLRSDVVPVVPVVQVLQKRHLVLGQSSDVEGQHARSLTRVSELKSVRRHTKTLSGQQRPVRSGSGREMSSESVDRVRLHPVATLVYRNSFLKLCLKTNSG
jgi:hypothetical protein